MKILVAYTTETGNTEKLAAEIFNQISEEKILRKIDEVENPNVYDMIYLGFPIHNFEPVEEAKSFIDGLRDNQKVVLFVTHATPLGYSVTNIQMENCRKVAKHLDLVGVFSCRGELSEEMARSLINSDDKQLQFFGKMRNHTIGHPNADDLGELREFVEKVQRSL